MVVWPKRPGHQGRVLIDKGVPPWEGAWETQQAIQVNVAKRLVGGRTVEFMWIKECDIGGDTMTVEVLDIDQLLPSGFYWQTNEQG